MKKHKSYGLSMILLALLVGLPVANSADAAEAFSGNWEGRWESYGGGSGGLSVQMTQSGSTLRGRLGIRNTDCGNFADLDLTGIVSNNRIFIYADAVCPRDRSYNELSFTQGVLSNNRISGDYAVISDGEFYDSGTFSLTRSINLNDASAGPGGTITPDGAISVNAGSDRNFTILASDGYRIQDVKVDGVSVGAISSYTFENISANHTITASFVLASNITPTILAPLLLDADR